MNRPIRSGSSNISNQVHRLKQMAVAMLGLLLLAGVALASCSSSPSPSQISNATKYSLTGITGAKVATSGPRLPPGWTLEPAGVQIKTNAQPSGGSLSPH